MTTRHRDAMWGSWAGLWVALTFSAACSVQPGQVDGLSGDGCSDDCGPHSGATGDDGDPTGSGDTDDAPQDPNDRPDGDGSGRDDDGPSGPSDDDGKDGSGGGQACCDQRRDTCLANGGSTPVCDGLAQICEGGSCEDLVTLCDPTVVPVSAACASAYYACFNFRINKCMRTNYSQCMSALDDDPLCTAWDASCAAREVACAEMLGVEIDCSPDDGEACDEQNDEGSPYFYDCTDWGHNFDPCWEAFQACEGDPAACSETLQQCMHGSSGDIYDTCENDSGGESDSSGDTDSGTPAG